MASNLTNARGSQTDERVVVVGSLGVTRLGLEPGRSLRVRLCRASRTGRTGYMRNS